MFFDGRCVCVLKLETAYINYIKCDSEIKKKMILGAVAQLGEIETTTQQKKNASSVILFHRIGRASPKAINFIISIHNFFN